MEQQKQKRPFKIEKKHREAAQKMAVGLYTGQEIADSLHVNRTTLWRWMKHPEMKRCRKRYERVFEAAYREALENVLEERFASLYRDMESDDPIKAYVASRKIIAMLEEVL